MCMSYELQLETVEIATKTAWERRERTEKSCLGIRNSKQSYAGSPSNKCPMSGQYHEAECYIFVKVWSSAGFNLQALSKRTKFL